MINTLYVVATPLGNLEDITLRAIKILLETPVIVCEDTRRTGILLSVLRDRYATILGITPIEHRKMISVRDWNEAEEVEAIMEELQVLDCVLVSDAGTPLLSDPGFKLVREARKRGFKISPIPGPFAGAAAASAAGLPTNKLLFWGFLPKHWELSSQLTHVIYESPVRAKKTVEEIMTKYHDAQVVVAKEMTKVHEEFLDGAAYLKSPGAEKGEITILVYIP